MALVEGRMMIAALPRTRRPPRRRPRTRNLKYAYTRFSSKVQYGQGLYQGYFAAALGRDPMGLIKCSWKWVRRASGVENIARFFTPIQTQSNTIGGVVADNQGASKGRPNKLPKKLAAASMKANIGFPGHYESYTIKYDPNLRKHLPSWTNAMTHEYMEVLGKEMGWTVSGSPTAHNLSIIAGNLAALEAGATADLLSAYNVIEKPNKAQKGTLMDKYGRLAQEIEDFVVNCEDGKIPGESYHRLIQKPFRNFEFTQQPYIDYKVTIWYRMRCSKKCKVKVDHRVDLFQWRFVCERELPMIDTPTRVSPGAPIAL